MRTDMDILHTDVLIIGGGAAALAAACAAAETGAGVLLVDAGRPARSGSSATAGGGTAAAFGQTCLGVPGNDDTPEIHFEDTLREGRGINNPRLVNLLVTEILPLVRRLTAAGVPYARTEEGLYYQNRGVGQSRPRNCTPRGNSAALCEWLFKTAAFRGAVSLCRMRILSLLHDGSRVSGAVAMRTDTGEMLCIAAGSVVIAAGSATALMPYASAAFPTWGDAFRLAWEAGAELANMEFLEFTFAPMAAGRVFSCGGSTQLVSRGARFINNAGEAFLERLPGLGSHPTRAALVPAFYREIRAGRGPIRLECASIPAARWEEWAAIGHPLIELLKALYGSGYQHETLAFTPALHCVLGGIVTGEWGETAVPGLFAAGEAATGVHGAARLGGNAIAECLVFGSRAGAAAAAAGGTSRAGVQQAREALEAFRGEESSEPFQAHVALLRQTAWETLGVVRTASELERGQRFFDGMAALAGKSRALSARSLCELLNLRGLALTAQLASRAALERTESRGCHLREDIPDAASRQTEAAWRLNIIFARDGGMCPRRGHAGC